MFSPRIGFTTQFNHPLSPLLSIIPAARLLIRTRTTHLTDQEIHRKPAHTSSTRHPPSAAACDRNRTQLNFHQSHPLAPRPRPQLPHSRYAARSSGAAFHSRRAPTAEPPSTAPPPAPPAGRLRRHQLAAARADRLSARCAAAGRPLAAHPHAPAPSTAGVRTERQQLASPFGWTT